MAFIYQILMATDQVTQMTTIAILSFLTGAVMGRSLRVMALVPAIAAGLAVELAVALATGAGLAWAAQAGLVVAVGLQAGYVAGVLIKHALAVARMPRSRSGFTAVARSET
jgi:hypothetical protein